MMVGYSHQLTGYLPIPSSGDGSGDSSDNYPISDGAGDGPMTTFSKQYVDC